MEELQQGYRYQGLEGAQRGHASPGLEIFRQYPKPFDKWPVQPPITRQTVIMRDLSHREAMMEEITSPLDCYGMGRIVRSWRQDTARGRRASRVR